MTERLRYQSVYDLLIIDGNVIYQYVLTTVPISDSDRTMVFLDRQVIAPCSTASIVDVCHGTNRYSFTVHEIRDSIETKEYQDLLRPGHYRIVLDFNDPAVRARYERFQLNAPIPQPETGLTKDNEREVETTEVLDAIREAFQNDDVRIIAREGPSESTGQ